MGDIFQSRNSLPWDFGVAAQRPGARREGGGMFPPSQAEAFSWGGECATQPGRLLNEDSYVFEGWGERCTNTPNPSVDCQLGSPQ